jgi:C1A family cysteine protease
MRTVQPHAYGWKRSLPDPTAVPADVEGLTALEEVDPRAELPAVYDQGQLGSCTANAVAGAFQYEQILANNYLAGEVPSRLFIYYGEREREGTVDHDAGAFGHDGFKVLRKTGVCPEAIWPYDISQFTEKPNEDAYREASLRKIGKYVHPGLPYHRPINRPCRGVQEGALE